MRIIGTWWLQPNSPVCSTSWSHRQHWEAGSLLQEMQILMACISYLTSGWSPKGRTGCGTSTHLQRTTAGVRLVRAVKADKRDHNSCLVAAGRLQRAVTVSFITAGFTNPISTAVSISKRNTKHWYVLVLVLSWFHTDCVIPARNCKLVDRKIGRRIFLA